MPSYVFTGDQPEEFPSLSYDLIQAGAADAVVHPGVSVVTADPVVHPRLKPTDPAELAAWAALYAPEDTAPAAPEEPVTPEPMIEPTPEPPAEPAPLPEG